MVSLLDTVSPWVSALIQAAIAICAALVVHFVVFAMATRLAARNASSIDDLYVAAARGPSRWLLIAVALAGVRPILSLSDSGDQLWLLVAGMAIPAIIGWMAINLIRATGEAVAIRADISVADNLAARRKRTRSAILTRIAVFVVGFLTLCLMLLSIPGVRSVGVTLMASAGLAGLAVGAAAQPLLKNLIAGIQMAFTEPIRIDDVVIIDGEWGRIEEIRLTYVVVAIWDERRLVVPVSRFLDDSFQNWTRNSSQLLGTVFFHLDPTADIDRIRARFEALVRANPRWDGRAQGLQVTEIRVDAIEVRGLATARDAGTAFDLRCDLREGMLAFLRDEMPEALPRRRTLIEGDSILAAASPASG
ncbi:mechanosensitive ion channel family protein [Sphingomonas sp. FW199]|uniref:mechanosensitive ion channel family protein n=1 Tax=Sphingomonas sp. FW199 TaxID=3400217 RepID=UPI003CE7EB51